jgi:hypothetical protein
MLLYQVALRPKGFGIVLKNPSVPTTHRILGNVREIDARELSPVESLIFCDWLMTRKILPFDQSLPVEFLRDSFSDGRVVKEVTWTDDPVSFLTKQVDVLTEFVRLTRSPLIGPTIEDTFDIMAVILRGKQSMDQTTYYKIKAILKLMWRNLFFDLFLKRSPMNFKTISKSMQRSPVAAQPRTLDDIEKDLEGRYSQGDVLLGRFLGRSIELSFRQFIRIASEYPYVLGNKEKLWAEMHPFHPAEPSSTKICGTFFFGDPPSLSSAKSVWWAFELLDKSFDKTEAERDLLCSWVQDAQNLGLDFDDTGWDAIKAKLDFLKALIYFREASPKVHQLCGGFTRLLIKESAKILEESVESWGSDLCVYIGFWNSHAIQEEDELLRWVAQGARRTALRTGSAERLSPDH